MDMIGNKIDVIIFGKTKLDGFFPRGQFKIPGFKQRYGLDLNARSGGLMVLIYGNISLKTLNRIDIVLNHSFLCDLTREFVSIPKYTNAREQL